MEMPKVLSWASSTASSFEQLSTDDVDVESDAPMPPLPVSLRRKCAAEFFGTFVLVGFGAGSVAQTALSQGLLGNYTHITLCWGIAVMLAINVAGGTSGAHLNPAFTIVFCTFYPELLPWRAAPGYCASQVLGAFCGFAAVYGMYYRAFQLYDPAFAIERSGRLFASYPQVSETLASAFVAEALCSGFFMIGAFALVDPKNPFRCKPLVPVLTGALVVGVGMAFGLTTGYALNPAIDVAGRIFSSLAGGGSDVFTAYSCYWWVPLVAPVLGGWIGQVDLRTAYAREEYVPPSQRNKEYVLQYTQELRPLTSVRPRSAGPEPSPPKAAERPISAHPRLHDKAPLEAGGVVTKADLRRKRCPDDVSDRVRQIYSDVGRTVRKAAPKRDLGEGLHETVIALKHELRQEQDRRLKVIAMKDKKLEESLALRSQHGSHQMQREMAAKERTHNHLLAKLREKLQQATSTIAAYEDTLNGLRSSTKHTHVMELEERLAQYEMELELSLGRLEAQDRLLDQYRKQIEDRSETAAHKTVKRLRTVVLSLNDDKKRLEHENRVLKECLAAERSQRRSPKKPKPPPKVAIADAPSSERWRSQSLRREIDGKLEAKNPVRPPSAGATRAAARPGSFASAAIVQRMPDIRRVATPQEELRATNADP
ncbi:aquaporin-7 [Achlya hypogyna]|uniref:Aquaporin-7 n=1 Tax=Achlya hypogyna TaxID=1202772 RepID=A0A1V9ZTQ2_ACHHY|nr:aquaporin-7 [Achlya hypogyna]